MAEFDGNVEQSNKSFKSAIILMPPETEWTQIQKIREIHDKAYNRWMPHINLIWPFIPDVGNNFATESQRIKQRLSHVKPFDVKFSKDSFNYFEHKQCVLWLGPLENNQPASQHNSVMELQKILQDLYPDHYDKSKEFQPHLTLGRFNRKQIDRVIKDFQQNWQDIEFKVNQIYLISRKGFNDPFEIKETISFQ